MLRKIYINVYAKYFKLACVTCIDLITRLFGKGLNTTYTTGTIVIVYYCKSTKHLRGHQHMTQSCIKFLHL